MFNKSKLNSSILYRTEPSFLKGVARTFDLFGTLDEYNFSATEKEADIKALKRDWQVVGNSIEDAIEDYDQNSSSSQATA
jgi:hypothetical protein